MTIAYLQRMADKLKAEWLSAGVDYWKVEERFETIIFFLTYIKEQDAKNNRVR